MTIIRSIVYASTATHDRTTVELEALQADARAFNFEHRVTGIPPCSGPSFMQCIEGEADVVGTVHDRTRRSSQHKDLVETIHGRIPDRAFDSGRWTWRDRPTP